MSELSVDEKTLRHVSKAMDRILMSATTASEPTASDLLAFLDAQRTYLDCGHEKVKGSWFIYFDRDYRETPEDDAGGWKAGVTKADGAEFTEAVFSSLREGLEYVSMELSRL